MLSQKYFLRHPTRRKSMEQSLSEAKSLSWSGNLLAFHYPVTEELNLRHDKTFRNVLLSLWWRTTLFRLFATAYFVPKFSAALLILRLRLPDATEIFMSMNVSYFTKKKTIIFPNSYLYSILHQCSSPERGVSLWHSLQNVLNSYHSLHHSTGGVTSNDLYWPNFVVELISNGVTVTVWRCLWLHPGHKPPKGRRFSHLRYVT